MLQQLEEYIYVKSSYIIGAGTEIGKKSKAFYSIITRDLDFLFLVNILAGDLFSEETSGGNVYFIEYCYR